jgi:hypothetical protein
MEILTVKIQGQGYLLNGTMSVPGNAQGNREYELIKQWLAEGNIPEPEFTDEELVAIEIANKKQEAKAYLANTAWYVERLNDPSSGKAIPEEVLTKRAEARLTLDEGAK